MQTWPVVIWVTLASTIHTDSQVWGSPSLGASHITPMHAFIQMHSELSLARPCRMAGKVACVPCWWQDWGGGDGDRFICVPGVCVCVRACAGQEDRLPSDQWGIPPSSPGLWLLRCSLPQRTQLLPDVRPVPWFFQPLEQGGG